MRNFDFEAGEVLLIDKPYRWTSFDVIGALRKFFRAELKVPKIKMGHAGTLDPLATGLLILCTGKATKRIDEFMGLEKEYTGTIMLGATTPSFDLEKEIDITYPFEHITGSQILGAAKSLTGEIMQVPPAFSAIKIDGKRAYKSARKGNDPGLTARPVLISEFEITRIALPEVDFRVVCSKGTYIRALARDFGEYLSSGAHLTQLCRTRIGTYRLEEAFSIEMLKQELKAYFGTQADAKSEI